MISGIYRALPEISLHARRVRYHRGRVHPLSMVFGRYLRLSGNHVLRVLGLRIRGDGDHDFLDRITARGNRAHVCLARVKNIFAVRGGQSESPMARAYLHGGRSHDRGADRHILQWVSRHGPLDQFSLRETGDGNYSRTILSILSSHSRAVPR
jgi:hypothetical protein